MKKIYLFLFLIPVLAKAQDPFIMTYNVAGGSNMTIKVPLSSGIENPFSQPYTCTIDFGDGIVSTLTQTGAIYHTYETPGIYTVSISGSFTQIRFSGPDSDSEKLLTIEQWGDTEWTSMLSAFSGCSNLTINATDVPDLSNVTNMAYMFSDCTSFNSPLNNWDVSNVTTMERLFYKCNDFNQSLNNWNTSNVTNMSLMFFNAWSFNQPIGNWDVSKVTSMRAMFSGAGTFNQPLNDWDVSALINARSMFYTAGSFNQDLNNWDVSNVTDMDEMFYYTSEFNGDISTWDVSSVTNMFAMFSYAGSFNQPLGNWDVSNVINMDSMFSYATLFNQPIDSWNVSNVTDMSSMFLYATSFNQPLGSWNVSSVTKMGSMFLNSDYNHPLNNWDVSSVVSMSGMFSNSPFNQPLDNWDTSSVVGMSRMFNQAENFNQPIDSWNVSAVTNMSELFSGATSFNQPLGSWNVSNVTIMSGMFRGATAFNQDISAWTFNENVAFNTLSPFTNHFLSNSGMDTDNYDAVLRRFIQLNLIDKRMTASNLHYCDTGAREHLINVLEWNITGDSLGEECQGNTITGTVLYDANANGCDNEDIAVSNFLISANDGLTSYSTVAAHGVYNLTVMENMYDVEMLNAPSYFTVNPVSTDVEFTGFGNDETVNFCMEANQTVTDLNTTLLPMGEPRPGMPSQYILIVENIGTETVNAATVTLSFDDSLVSFTNADPAPASVAANQMSFSINNLPALHSQQIMVTMQAFIPPVVNGGETLIYTATVTPASNDYTPNDNTFELEQTIVNSYDPNDKTVLQGEEIYLDETDNYLNYVIRFQNTGTASALKVRIADELHPLLDWTTLRPVGSSHPYRVEITDDNLAEFIFENINLPHESANEPGSHGFIAYKIKPAAGVEVGDIISGDARIYFDFNLPIITNIVSTEVIEDTTGNEEFSKTKIRLYPNPASNMIHIEYGGSQPESISVSTLQGRTMISSTENLQSLDISGLSTGIYLVFIKTAEEGSVHRLVKK